MKNNKVLILLGLAIICMTILLIVDSFNYGYKSNNVKTDTVVSVVRDTIVVRDNKEINNLRQQLSIVRDSVQIYKDSIEYVTFKYNQQIIIRDIKLARIKEYNRIAGQRNNIKYLRGWINRVLN